MKPLLSRSDPVALFVLLFAAVCIAILLPATVAAQSSDATRGLSGLPTPRFVSIASGEANMRTGPGRTYPVKWTYVRRGLPMEVVREWGIWRQLKDPAGATGWMNKHMLTGTRMVFVRDTAVTLYSRASLKATPTWKLSPGVIARIQLCEQGWCRVSVDGRSGYAQAADLWGVYPGETIE